MSVRHLKIVLCSLVCAGAVAARASAQDAAPAPAYLSIVTGAATIDRDGAPDQALVNMPVVPGDRLRTTTGRVEILFPDGAALDVDEFSALEIEAADRVRLTEGRALMRAPAGRVAPVRYELTTPATTISVISPGEYRLSYPDAYESARAEEFEHWIDESRAVTAAPQTPYLPANLQVYGSTLAQEGSWDYESAYGYVWYPSVEPTWQPYAFGYWASIRPYGWTWIGTERWAWPTHHYGRWGYAHNRWFWIPGRSWAPAWVAWGMANDYVSWCPLGWDSHALFDVSMGTSHAWFGWRMVPRSTFASHASIHAIRQAVDPRRLPMTTPVIVQTRAPSTPPPTAIAGAAGSVRAVPRNGGTAASRAVPRAAGTPRPQGDPQEPRVMLRESPGQAAAPRDRFYTRPADPASSFTRAPASEPLATATPAPAAAAASALPLDRSYAPGGIYIVPRAGVTAHPPAIVRPTPRWDSPRTPTRVQPMLPTPSLPSIAPSYSQPAPSIALPRITAPVPPVPPQPVITPPAAPAAGSAHPRPAPAQPPAAGAPPRAGSGDGRGSGTRRPG